MRVRSESESVCELDVIDGDHDVSSLQSTMLLRGTLVHTPRLGDLEILDDYLIGLKYVRATKAFSLL